MTAHAEGDRPGEQGASHIYDNVTCPFCGLLCDDLQDHPHRIDSEGQERLPARHRRLPAPAAPGHAAGARAARSSFEEAVKAAAGLIRAAKLPLYGGMASDVAGARAVLSIADRTVRRPRSCAERRPVPQLPRRADERLDHVHAHRDAQPRRPHPHRRHRRAQAARPLLRSHRDEPAHDVRRRRRQAHRRLHRRGPRHLRGRPARASRR